MTEATLVEKTASLLEDAGYTVYREVPFWLRRIDLVAVAKDGSQLIALEAKLTAWQKAVEQASVYQLCAREVIIAMPTCYAHRPDESVLKERGIGLWAVSDGIETRIPPLPSPIFRPHLEARLMQTINRWWDVCGERKHDPDQRESP